MTFRLCPTILIAVLICTALPACKKFPELEVSEVQFDSKTPYPKFVPLDILLKEPEATITDEVEDNLTSRRDTLQDTPVVSSAQAEKANDPVLDRLDALNARLEAQAAADPIIDDALRKRMEGGINPPTLPE